jgi:acyl-CoA dehydrogenase
VLAEGVLGRLYEDVRSLRIYEGATEIHKALVARELLSAHAAASGPLGGGGDGA